MLWRKKALSDNVVEQVSIESLPVVVGRDAEDTEDLGRPLLPDRF